MNLRDAAQAVIKAARRDLLTTTLHNAIHNLELSLAADKAPELIKGEPVACPAPQAWQGLTDDEWKPINEMYGFNQYFCGYYNRIEAALKAKNDKPAEQTDPWPNFHKPQREAFRQGKEIQCYDFGLCKWSDCPDPNWSPLNLYRVAPIQNLSDDDIIEIISTKINSQGLCMNNAAAIRLVRLCFDAASTDSDQPVPLHRVGSPEHKANQERKNLAALGMLNAAAQVPQGEERGQGKYQFSQPIGELSDALNVLQELVNLYVANQGTDGEFISCRTPPHASEMTPEQRAENKTWKAFDRARAILEAARGKK